jgi:wyosine [tRNA(Phe)-imidazoG37] synthetase (radical SAM superfamily)
MPVFGFVPSRRLGKSLGVNNIPYKYCSYSCVYCQLGRTGNLTVKRRAFYDPDTIFREVRERIFEIGYVDYITFVADGEPTIDINLGAEISILKDFGKVAVITNSSLVFQEDVRRDLEYADLVSLKVDAVSKNVWRKINRPHPHLDLKRILDGITDFAHEFDGKLITETMLIKGYNDDTEEIEKLAEFIAELNPRKAYIAVPTRPPAEKVLGAGKSTLERAKEVFEEYVSTDILSKFEGSEFAIKTFTDLLKIAAVHPIREDVLKKVLDHLNLKFEDISKEFTELSHQGKKYYRKKID